MLKFLECGEPIKMSKLWQRRRTWEKLNHQFRRSFTLLFLLFELNFHISNFYENKKNLLTFFQCHLKLKVTTFHHIETF